MGAKHLPGRVSLWRTSGDRTRLLERADLKLRPIRGDGPASISLNAAEARQSMLGFGAAMTDASAYNLWHRLSPERRDEAMADLFGPTGISLSMLRIPIGATDFSTARYTYDDRPWPFSDRKLERFSIGHDEAYMLPLLRQAQAINPELTFIASPWSPPAWMKRFRRMNGGRLKSGHYDTYARYLVRFLQSYAEAGIHIQAITIQNEPGHAAWNYPSMPMSVDEQSRFITDHMRPALDASGLATKIWAHDHNWNDEEKVSRLLSSPGLAQAVSGVAWHAYAGEASAQSRIHDRFPHLDTHFTEVTGSQGSLFSGDLAWGMHNIIIGATANWSRSVMYWNLALDDRNGPLSGGYNRGRGVITTHDDGSYSRNVEYYTLAHISRFVRIGAQCVTSVINDDSLEGVAFKNPDGSKVLIVRRTKPLTDTVKIQDGSSAYEIELNDNEAITAVWF